MGNVLELFEYIEGLYNRARRHSTFGYLSLVEFGQRAAYSSSGVHWIGLVFRVFGGWPSHRFCGRPANDL